MNRVQRHRFEKLRDFLLGLKPRYFDHGSLVKEWNPETQQPRVADALFWTPLLFPRLVSWPEDKVPHQRWYLKLPAWWKAIHFASRLPAMIRSRIPLQFMALAPDCDDHYSYYGVVLFGLDPGTADKLFSDTYSNTYIHPRMPETFSLNGPREIRQEWV